MQHHKCIQQDHHIDPHCPNAQLVKPKGALWEWHSWKLPVWTTRVIHSQLFRSSLFHPQWKSYVQWLIIHLLQYWRSSSKVNAMQAPSGQHPALGQMSDADTPPEPKKQLQWPRHSSVHKDPITKMVSINKKEDVQTFLLPLKWM